MKLFLCAVILATAAATGFCISSAFRARERLLAQMVRELRQLEEQVRLGRPLEQALRSDGMRVFGALAGGIDDLTAAWSSACESARHPDLLAAAETAERQAMAHFWEDAGALDMHSQSARFKDTLHTLATLHAQASEEAAQRSRLYSSLGLLLGLAAVILLW